MGMKENNIFVSRTGLAADIKVNREYTASIRTGGSGLLVAEVTTLSRSLGLRERRKTKGGVK